VSHYRSDPELEKEIRELLASSQEVNAENIEVFVQTGNVTLRGTVKTPEERDAAGRIAARGLGVGEIFNELVVEESK
jgi:osmotically-inducible protein OsmY